MAQIIKSNKKLKICYIPYFGYETGNGAFDEKHKYRWTNVLQYKLRKSGHSIATYDINTIQDSDYIISFDNTYFQNVRHFWNIWRAGKLGRTLHIDYEPPSAMAKIHSDKGLKLLSKIFTVMTYNDNVVNGDTILKGVVGDYYEKERPYKDDFDKRQLVCMVANNRSGKVIEQSPSGLYLERRDAARYFTTKHPKTFDLYGDFWPDEFKSKGPVSRNKKFDVISKYKFIISYDSISNQNGYISEKIFDAFKAKTVPVYWGADNVTDYIPKECFIDKRDFADYEELFLYLNSMTKKEYATRIHKIEKYLQSNQFKETFSSEAIADEIVKFINKKPRHVNYLFAGMVLLWFEFLRRTKPYYNWHNYYFDSRPNISNTIVRYVDKGQHNDIPEFLVHVSVAHGEVVYHLFGDSVEYKEVNLSNVVENGSYREGTICIPYETIYKNGRSVAFYTRKGGRFIRLSLRDFAVVNATHWDDFLKFRAKDNKIMLIKKPNHYTRSLKKVIRK